MLTGRHAVFWFSKAAVGHPAHCCFAAWDLRPAANVVFRNRLSNSCWCLMRSFSKVAVGHPAHCCFPDSAALQADASAAKHNITQNNSGNYPVMLLKKESTK